MRISDWSADVCSSDLLAARVAAERGRMQESAALQARAAALSPGEAAPFALDGDDTLVAMAADAAPLDPSKAIPAISADIAHDRFAREIGRASCRERVCQIV